jgi:hypothetical protein
MRGEHHRQVEILLGVVADDLVPQDHLIGGIRLIGDRALREQQFSERPQLSAIADATKAG